MGTPYTYNTAGALVATPIAPDWDVITTGSGSFSVYQLAVSDTTVSTNPSYALVISGSSGYSQPLLLRQRLYNTARIFAQDYVNGTMSVAYLSGTIPTITMSYVPSATGTPEIIVSGLLSVTGYTVITGNSVQITPTNTGAVPSAYIDITISIPVGTGVAVTAVQICGVSDASETVAYTQSTNARQTDHFFHYYEPQLLFKPISSLLTGWDFALNPQQFVISSFTTTPIYVWDQLICASAVNTINTTTNANTFGFSATTTVANEAFYMLQYLQNDSAVKTSMSNLAVNINAYSATNPGVKVRVYLFYNNGGGTIPVLSTPATIGIIAASGVFTLTAANWTQIPQIIPLATGTTDFPITINQTLDTTKMDFPFIGFTGGSNFNAVSTPNFAIVVTFAVPTSGTTVNVNSISLVPGDIATRPAPQTTDEVLRECQYYYEKTYAPGVIAGTATAVGQQYAINESVTLSGLGGTTDAMYLQSWGFNYKTQKRIAVDPTFYSPTGTINSVQGVILKNGTPVIVGVGGTGTNPMNFLTTTGSKKWTINSMASSCYLLCNSTSTLVISCGATTATAGDEGAMWYHYVIDARLGVV